MALRAAIPHTSTGNTTPSQPASGTNGRSQASVLGTTPDYWKPCAVARFRSVLGPPPGLIRDRDGSRESARSTDSAQCRSLVAVVCHSHCLAMR